MTNLQHRAREQDSGFHRCLPGRGTVSSSLLVVLVLAALQFNCGPSHDRHTLAVSGVVHVYRTVTPPAEYPGSDFIDVIGPKDQVKVMEVVRKANYLAVRVRLRDGREGWVFSGEGIELR